ncbi:MAG: carbohydrate-binding protein [Verrucomicrobiales bacterium]|nr:carbohydrate-binding protein [Verrucomicrobiales bacterium]
MKRFFESALVFACSAGILFANTPPEYTVTRVPNPPSKFETKQIDGLDFLPDGRMAVCLPSGEIFFYDTKADQWQLFAEGLHNPLGLVAVSNSELIVSQRPEVTRVRDTNGDGKADDFEVVSDGFGMSGNYHEFHFTPVRDKDGAIYFALGTGSSGDGVRSIVRGKFDPRGRPGRMHASTPFRGCVMKVTPDGKTIPWSYGHRTPNGLGFDLKGNLFVTDNQGDWVGSSKLFHVKEGRFYGHAPSLTWKEGFKGAPLETDPEVLAKMRTRACVVFPHGTMANSPTQVLAITPEANFGPFTGQLLVGEMNKSRVMRILLEEIGGELQGACVPFIGGSPMPGGCNRLGWGPDGSLYVGHTKHTWAGSEGITRIEWGGELPFEAVSMNLTKTGFRFTFTKPVDREIAANPATWPFKRYYYQYHRKYGSPQIDLTPVPVEAIEISQDGKTVELALAELKAWHIHELTVAGLKAEDGTPLANTNFVYTLNRLLENTPPDPLQFGGSASRGGGGSEPAHLAKPIPVVDPAGTVYQAEDARRDGPALQTGNSGFTGRNYADFGTGEQSIEWVVKSEKAGEGKVMIRYALAGGGRPLDLVVNGEKVETLPFSDTGGWKSWGDLTRPVMLRKGDNRIALKTIGKTGGNIDHIQIVEP